MRQEQTPVHDPIIAQEYIFPTSRSVLPPANLCATKEAYQRTLNHLRHFNDEAVAHTLAENLCFIHKTREAKLYSSGKDALFHVFCALATRTEKRLVAMPAYCCPDVAASAVRAGFRILPLDADRGSSRASHQALETASDDPKVAAVVLPNLYGLADPIPETLRQRSQHDLLLVDDACQSAHSYRGSTVLGSTPNAIGILSFGRGKSYSGLGGGAVLIPEHEPNDSLIATLALGSEPTIPSALKAAALAQAQWLFRTPLLYRIPASIPWLGLGETQCSLAFSLGTMNRAQLLHAITQLYYRTVTRQDLQSQGRKWLEYLAPVLTSGIATIDTEALSKDTEVCTRLPLIFDKITDKERFQRAAIQAGLGVSGSYPAPIQAFPAISSQIEPVPCLNAEKLARTLVTLPVHPYVAARHMEKTVSLLKR